MFPGETIVEISDAFGVRRSPGSLFGDLTLLGFLCLVVVSDVLGNGSFLVCDVFRNTAVEVPGDCGGFMIFLLGV